MALKAKTVFAGINTREAYEVGATRKGIAIKTGILAALVLLSGFLFPTMLLQGMMSSSTIIITVVIFVVGALVCGFVGQLVPAASMVCSILYSVFEGAILGLISFAFEAEWSGIVLSAILITESIFVVMLIIYSTGLVKVTRGFVRAMISIFAAGFLFMLIYFIAGLINPYNMLAVAFQTYPGLMIAVSLFVILYGAFMLLMDFEYANNLVNAGFDKKYEWTAALGIMITLVWIYVEVLRILAIIMSRRD